MTQENPAFISYLRSYLQKESVQADLNKWNEQRVAKYKKLGIVGLGLIWLGQINDSLTVLGDAISNAQHKGYIN